jgi:methionyl-tRNA formyltransferase
MRVLFFGTAEFAVPCLEALVDSGKHNILAVVTQPDKPQGRGRQLAFSPIKSAAERLGLTVLQPRRVRREEFLDQARELSPDVLVVAAFGQIIPQALLDLPPFGPINVHGSLLPSYRGAAPIQHAILNGDSETGITTMWMDATLDTGDMLLKHVVPITDEDTTGTLTEKMAHVGAQLLLETLDQLVEKTYTRVVQDNSLATFAPPIVPEDGIVRWHEPAVKTRNRIRALSPRPGVFASIKGKRVKLWAAQAMPETETESGVVQAVTKAGVEVGTGSGTLLVTEAQPENSRRMPATDWARGARIAAGDRFDVIPVPEQN